MFDIDQKVTRGFDKAMGNNAIVRTRDITRLGNIVGAASNPPATGVITTSLSAFTGTQPYASLYEEYRLAKVRIHFFLEFDSTAAGAGSATAGYLPRLVVAFDPNDSTPSPSEADILEYDTAQILCFSAAQPSHTIEFTPNPLMTVGGSSFANLGPQWISTGFAGATHHGLKYVLMNNANTSLTIALYVECHWEFRKPK